MSRFTDAIFTLYVSARMCIIKENLVIVVYVVIILIVFLLCFLLQFSKTRRGKSIMHLLAALILDVFPIDTLKSD